MMQKLQLFISTCNKINMYANNSVINSNASLSFNIRLPTQAEQKKTSPPRVFKELAITIPKFLPSVFIQAACNLAYCRLRDESHIGRVVRIVGYANEGYWKYRAIVVDDYLPMRTYTA